MLYALPAAVSDHGSGGARRSGRPARAGRWPVPAWVWAALIVVLLAGGLVGAFRYVDGFWLYRGFPAPRDPSFVRLHGTEQTIHVRSAALGGRSQQVVVYLPPCYAQRPHRRYPVMYLLHGAPGDPFQFLQLARMGTLVDRLTTQGRLSGVILVAPFGSTGMFTDTEWANGVRPDQGWETFVARDVVRAIDRRYRAIPAGAGRAIAGLSAGGYGALNIALHHPGEFRVIESWSGYTQADDIPSIFGGQRARLAYNSPGTYLPTVAPELRRDGIFVWMYSGRRDRLRVESEEFAAELARYRIRHTFFIPPGGHTWRLWRGHAAAALLAATGRLSHG